MRDFKAKNAVRTQRASHIEVIRATLEKNPGVPVAAPHLQSITGSLAIHSRIADLRLLGMNITNETVSVFRDGVLVRVSNYTYWPNDHCAALAAPEEAKL